MACLAGAIYRRESTATVLVNPDRCINCASCAMACPYGVIRFHEDPLGPAGWAIAIKCDNCGARVAKGLIPACVETCKTGALTYEEMDDAMARKTRAVARSLSAPDRPAMPAGVVLLTSIKQAEMQLGER
jgi:carbon-monoxide dehydrogenase iron sulfur subunit